MITKIPGVLLSLLFLVFSCAAEPRVPDVSPTRRSDDLRVLSFNTWSVPLRDHHAERTSLTAAAIAELGCDVVLLQEVWREQDAHVYAQALRDSGLHHVTVRASARALALGSSGLLIASRFPLRDEAFVPYEFGAAPWWPWPPDWYANKGVLMATLDTPEGRVRVVNTHIHAAYESGAHLEVRLGQTLELARSLHHREPILLGGDLNATADELPTRALQQLVPNRLLARHRIDAIHTIAGTTEQLLRVGAARTRLSERVRLHDGQLVHLSDHPALEVSVERRPADATIRAGLTPALQREVLRSLQAEKRRGRLHRDGGRGATALWLALALLSIRGRTRGRLLLTLLCLWGATWSSYHGWIAGPQRANVAETHIEQLPRSVVQPSARSR